jgi:hypothetical protein
MKSFNELQVQLGRAWALNKPGGRVEHVLVALPSFSLGESLLSHYAARIPALEHRYLVAHLMLHRIEACEVIFLSCSAPGDDVLDYYTSLVPAACRASVRSRFRSVVVPDETPRSVAAKLLDQPDLLEALRTSFAGRPVFIEPWNVTKDEVELAIQLEAPINGTSPDLWPMGFKSAGRRLFAKAGVPTPVGREGVRTVEDVLNAVAAIRTARPNLSGVVIKHDNSGAGDGNAVIDVRDISNPRVSMTAWNDAVRARVQALTGTYLDDLRRGGVVEELISGAKFTSPSVQVDITPFGDVLVVATHEQVLGGVSGQVYTGCRFPADSAYASVLAAHGIAIGRELARLGAVGRFSADFAAVRDERGRWSLFALEVNLRKGGTTHPYAVLRHLVPGRYDAATGEWLLSDGVSRSYCATDNVVDENWVGLPPSAVIQAVESNGLQFDYASGTGVVLHMLSCLAVDGRFGMTVIGRSPEHAARLDEAARAAVKQGT